MAGGWLKLWRKIAQSEIWLSDTFSRGQAWVDLLLLASTGGRDVPGQVAHTQRWFAKRWKWSQTSVSRFFDELASAGMITVCHDKGSRGCSIVHISSWSKYQATTQIDPVYIVGTPEYERWRNQ